ncbi:MAG: response regulator [Pseudomonadales bacterium]|nr:response regulator [Pseudomonadales bacterium]
MKIWRLSLFFFLFAVSTASVKAAVNQIVIDGEEHTYPLAGHTRFYRDDEGSLTLEGFLAMDKEALPVSDPRGMVYGVTDKFYWFYTKVKNQTANPNWLLAFQYFGNGGAQVFVREEQGDWQLIGEVKRNIPRHFFVPSMLEPYKDYELVIKSVSPGPDKFHIFLLDQIGKERFVVADNRWLGLFYGGIITLILYNIFVALSMRSYSYGAYVLYLFSILAFLFTLDGFGQIYWWGENEEWSRSSYYVLVGFFVACGCQFCRLFLATKVEHPIIDKQLFVLIICGLILSLVELSFSSHPVFTNFAMLLASIYAFVIFVIGIIAYVKGNRVARYFLLAWFFPVFGVLYTTSMYAGFVPFDTIGYNMFHVTSLIQAIMLSMALADRINFFREERETAINASKLRLEVSNKELAKANKLKNAFLGTISHELRTPMNGVIASIPLLKRFLKGKEETELLDTMEASSDSMLKMVDRILSFSEIQAGTAAIKREPIALNQWVSTHARRWQHACEQRNLNWHLNLQTEADLGVSIDQLKVKQVLSELVANAIKFTTKGDVTLMVDVYMLDRQDYLRFRVKDTGIGIPRSRRLDVFKSFNQVQDGFDRQYGGLGIGLALSKEIALMMNARIKILDCEDGCLVSFYLPLLRAEPEKMIALEQPKLEPQHISTATSLEQEQVDNLRPLNILVVEDNPVNQMIMKKILGSLGHEFSVADDGVQAVAASKEQHYDLILMDCQMPNMDGFEATRLIRSEDNQNRATPIIAVTANAMEADRERCLAAGMNDYLKKPVKPAMIDDALHRWASDEAA